MNREVVRAWAPLAALVAAALPVLTLLGPALQANASGLALLAPLLAAGLAAAVIAAVVAAVFSAARAPVPVRVRAHRRNAPPPSRVEVQGRPEQPRAPGCGL